MPFPPASSQRLFNCFSRSSRGRARTFLAKKVSKNARAMNASMPQARQSRSWLKANAQCTKAIGFILTMQTTAISQTIVYPINGSNTEIFAAKR